MRPAAGATELLGPWKKINPQSYLSFRPYSALMPTANISICTVGISTEYEPKSGVIFVDLFLSMTLKLLLFPAQVVLVYTGKGTGNPDGTGNLPVKLEPIPVNPTDDRVAVSL